VLAKSAYEAIGLSKASNSAHQPGKTSGALLVLVFFLRSQAPNVAFASDSHCCPRKSLISASSFAYCVGDDTSKKAYKVSLMIVYP